MSIKCKRIDEALDLANHGSKMEDEGRTRIYCAHDGI